MASLLETLTVLSEYYGKSLSDAEAGIYISTLSKFSDDQIEVAAHKHIASSDRGRFFPKVADFMLYLPKQKSHPLPDEAWSIAVRLADESDSVTTTPEILEAWCNAQPVYLDGDKIGARMAFKDTYSRIINQSSEEPKWSLSLGHDPEKRESERGRAVAAGLLPAPDPSPGLEYDGSESDALENKKTVLNEILNIFDRMEEKEAEAAKARHEEMTKKRDQERRRTIELQEQAERLLAKNMAREVEG